MSRYLPLAVVVVLILVTILVAPPLIDRLQSPWAFTQGGAPSLTGAWSGVLTTESGARLGLAMQLRRKTRTTSSYGRVYGGSPYGRLVGEASICHPDGRIVRYTVDGVPEDWRARRFRFHAAPAPPAPDGLTISWSRARWSGGDVIEAETNFFWRRGAAASSGPEYPDTTRPGAMRLRRAAAVALAAPCAIL